jgi:PPOX class probable F420-dependent enzyme
MPVGHLQSSLVWCDYDGECACVNTSRERQKGKSMRADPRVTLLVVDPEDTARYIEICGDAELFEDGALGRLDASTRVNTRHPRYDGFVFPAEKQQQETRVIARIKAAKVTLDAIRR